MQMLSYDETINIDYHRSQSRQFLFVLWEGGGTLPPELGLARRLVQRGHRVRVLADPCIEVDARAAGCEFTPYVRAPHRYRRSPETDFVRDWDVQNPFKVFALQRDRLTFGPAQAYAEDVLATLEKYPADAVAIDASLFGGMVGAEKSGLPSALLMPHCYLFPAPGLPGPGPGFFPPQGPLDHLRDALHSQIVNLLFRTALPKLNAARKHVGLPPLKRVLDQLNRLDRVLVMTSQAFDFEAQALPPNVRYVGPQLDDPPWASTWESPWPHDHPHPLVVVGFSTAFQDQGPILQRIIDAMSTMPVRGLVTTGPMIDPQQLRGAANVVVCAAAPHSQVFPHASAVVTHAGHGTIIRALAHGLPLVCIPMGHDQSDNTTRVVARGVGVRSSTSASVTELRNAIQQVISTSSFRTNAQRIARVIAHETARAAAIVELEQLAVPVPATLERSNV